MHKMNAYKVIVALIFSLVSTSLYAGTLEIIFCDKPICSIRFIGNIEQRDIQKFANIKEQAKSNSYLITLNSLGGDVDAALSIADLLVDLKVTTGVSKGAKCYSACVILLSSGMVRINKGEVGIHSMYSNDIQGSYADKVKKFAKFEARAKKLFRETGVSDSLWDEMQRVPSEDLRIVSESELIRIGLVGESSAYRDYENDQAAGRFGITKQELLKRRAKEKIFCTQEEFSIKLECTYKVMNGKKF